MSETKSESSAEKIGAFLSSVPSEEAWDPLRQAVAFSRIAEEASTELLARKSELAPAIANAHGFSPHEAERAIREAFEPVKGGPLLKIWNREVAPRLDLTMKANDRKHFGLPELSVIFGGGAIPQPNIIAILAAGMVSRKVLFRPSSHDSILGPRFIECLAARAAAGKSSARRALPEILAARWPHDDATLTREIVAQASSLVVFGDGGSVEELSSYARPECQRFIYGPRVSFAVLDLGRLPSLQNLAQYAEPVAEDIVAYDQRGCLSPTTLYLMGGDAKLRRDFVTALRLALIARAKQQGFAPRIPGSTASAIHSLRAIYLMDGSGHRAVFSNASLPGWTLLYDETDISLRDTPGYQTLFVCPVAGWPELMKVLDAAPSKSFALQGLGVGPDKLACPKEYADRLRARGLTRICLLGQMQSPPLEWMHDGNPFFPVRLGTS